MSLIIERIDKEVNRSNDIIERHLDNISNEKRGVVSQDILSNLRTLVEHIMCRNYAESNHMENYDYDLIIESIKFCKKNHKTLYLWKFHKNLQIVSSHYTLEQDNSEIIMLKYIEYLFKIRRDSEAFGYKLLSNLEKFPTNIDRDVFDYYELILNGLKEIETKGTPIHMDKIRYYIVSKKSLFINGKIIYEIVLTEANNNRSKYDRIVAFTELDILDNYSLMLKFRNIKINVKGNDIDVIYITDWLVDIRPVEIEMFSKVFGYNLKSHSGNAETRSLMQYMTNNQVNLLDILDVSNDQYNANKEVILSLNKGRTRDLFDMFDDVRDVIINEKSGHNIIRYILFTMNYDIIKNQYNRDGNFLLSNLHLEYKSIPFDVMPLCTSLSNHNPRMTKLMECIKFENREHELFARTIKNNSEVNNKLYTSIDNLSMFKDIENLVHKFNTTLYKGENQQKRRIVIRNNNVYIKSYEDDVIFIIKKLREKSNMGLQNYSDKFNVWNDSDNCDVDCMEKKSILEGFFINTKIGVVYGSAGTGKTTIIKHISDLFTEYSKLYLSVTNSSVNNLQSKIGGPKSMFRTIASVRKRGLINYSPQILFLDESSIVSNEDMKFILETIKPELIVIVGDDYQIESIRFGNWFSLLRMFLSEDSVHELKTPYRSEENTNMQNFWDSVRQMSDNITEVMVKNIESSVLNDSIFKEKRSDEIILCLQYDGLYGINNVNKIMQQSNPNNEIRWGLKIYKVGDPIIFDDVSNYNGIFINNDKGVITGMEIEDDLITFTILIEKEITEQMVAFSNVSIIRIYDSGYTEISFGIISSNIVDENLESMQNIIVPFQVSYCISIHKAQGLEYENVKVVITNNIQEQITHNIFYTAVTRATKRLKIYWSAETSDYIMRNIKPRDIRKDYYLLKGVFQDIQ